VRRNLFWLSDEQWSRIKSHLPTDVRGVERVDDHRVISGIVHVLKSDCRWCDCPPEYGPATTIYTALYAGRGAASGKTFSGSLLGADDPLPRRCSLRQLIPDEHILARVDRVLDLSWLREEVANCYCLDDGRPGIDPEVAVRLMLAGRQKGE
jgi:hypothetical protein